MPDQQEEHAASPGREALRSARRAPRLVFIGHTAVLSGAELCLLDTAALFPGSVVYLFADGPLAEALRARGVSVEILGFAESLSRVKTNAGLWSVAQSVPAAWRLAQELARRTGPDDILYANTQKSWMMLAIIAWQLRRRIIWHLHDVMSAGHFNRPLARVAVLLANRLAAAVIVNSRATGEAFVELGGRPGLLRVVYNGIDPKRYAPMPRDERAALRSALGLPPDRLVVGLFGRITPWKGQHVLLEALRRLHGVYAIIVGGVLFGEHDYLRKLETMASDPALAGRVKFLGFRDDVPALMQIADIVVHTSTAPEPFGRVIVEAMLSRRPIIATALGGVPEIIDSGVDGLLIPPADSWALARAIETVAANMVLRRALTAAAYETARDRFSPTRVRRAVRAIVDEVGCHHAVRRSDGEADPTKESPSTFTPQRILLISHSAEASGAELSLVDIACSFGQSGRVCLFRPGPIVDLLRGRGVEVAVLNGAGRWFDVRRRPQIAAVVQALPSVVMLAWRLSRLTKSVDIVCANSQKAWIVSALAGWLSGKPVVWHLRDIVSSPGFSPWLVRLSVWLANRRAARVLVNSAATGQAFVQRGGKRDLVRVIHNGIDEAPFNVLGDEHKVLRRRLGLRDEETVVGMFGRIAPWKGQHVLLQALERVTGVRALIVGEALFGEQEYRRELERFLERRGLRERVSLLGYRDDVPVLMKAVDIVVHASTEPEPFGRVIVEAMFAERPVIAAGAGGVTEIVTDGTDGLLVTPNDPEALASALTSLIENPALAHQLATAGRKKAERQFSLGEMYRRISAEFQTLVSAAR